MNDILRQFYSEDASIKSLKRADQIRRFNDWAAKNSLPYKLEFSRPKTKLYSFTFVLLLAAYVILLIIPMEHDYKNLFTPVSIILLILGTKQTPQIVSV
jgi:hypothetical protein